MPDVEHVPDERAVRVFVVDDEPGVLRAIGRVLRSHGFDAMEFDSAERFLEQPPYEGIACVVLDLRMPSMGGLAVQDEMLTRGLLYPVVFLSGQGDVPSSVQAMRNGAIDFLVKPIDETELIAAIVNARAWAVAARQRRQSEIEAELRLGQLTPRQREVCDLVARGLLNKQIAFDLGISEKNVKVHRSKAMRKLGIGSVPALVRLLEKLPSRKAG